jgi:hypothetical protein
MAALYSSARSPTKSQFIKPIPRFTPLHLLSTLRTYDSGSSTGDYAFVKTTILFSLALMGFILIAQGLPE